MSTTRRVGNLVTTESKQGFEYELQYFVLDDDKATYTPYYGLAGNTAPFEFPAGTYISWWQDTPYADHWLVTIRAKNNDYDEGQGGDGFGSDPLKVFKEYTITEHYMHPNYWGVVKCTQDHKNENSLIKQLDGVTLADIGDWIYANAVRDTVDGTGTPQCDTKFNPFTAASMNIDGTTKQAANMPIGWLGKKIPTVILHVQFYTSSQDTNPMENYLEWTGVNGPTPSVGGSPGAWTPGPSDVKPTGYLDAGTWLSQNQTLIYKKDQFDGVYYDLIERWMVKAPESLKWDYLKFGADYWDWNGA